MAPRPVRQVFTTAHFDRAFRKLPESIRKTAIVKDRWFRADAFDGRLRAHALGGVLKGLWAYSVDRRRRILFEFIAPDQVLYHDVGSHDLYR